LTSQYRSGSQTHDSNAPVQTFRLGYPQRATLAASFLPVCLRIQFQENEVNLDLICSLYMSLRIVAHCLPPLKRRCLCTLMFMVSIIGVLCIVKLLYIAHKTELSEIVIVHLLSFPPLLYSDVAPFSLNPFSTYRKQQIIPRSGSSPP
jgi:hypothetical protein